MISVRTVTCPSTGKRTPWSRIRPRFRWCNGGCTAAKTQRKHGPGGVLIFDLWTMLHMNSLRWTGVSTNSTSEPPQGFRRGAVGDRCAAAGHGQKHGNTDDHAGALPTYGSPDVPASQRVAGPACAVGTSVGRGAQPPNDRLSAPLAEGRSSTIPRGADPDIRVQTMQLAPKAPQPRPPGQSGQKQADSGQPPTSLSVWHAGSPCRSLARTVADEKPFRR